MDESPDREVRTFAQENDFTIVTKDADYSELTMLLGYPPKVIWIRRGNCSTNAIESMLRIYFEKIDQLSSDPAAAIMTIY